MPGTYDHNGISFQYPENWTLEESDPQQWPRSITLHGPTGALWQAVVDSTGTPGEKLVETMLAALKEEYEDIEAEEAHEEVAGFELEGLDLSFFYLDLVVFARLRATTVGDRSYALVYQAENREFEELLPVFSAMTVSLLL